MASNQLRSVVDLDQLSTRLKALRGRLGLFQDEVADDLGVPRRTFQSWENGEVQTNGDNYDMIADYYSEKLGEEIARDQLLFGRSEAPSYPERHAIDELERVEETMRAELEERLGRLRAELFAELGLRQHRRARA